MVAHRLAQVTAGMAVCAGCVLTGWVQYSAPTPVLLATTSTTGRVAGTPCIATVKACVDLTTRHAWLVRDGRIALGPVPISSGGPGEETPLGTFEVWRKDQHHVSMEQHGTPMPHSVFFDRGVAFHSGPLTLPSAGCVHLRDGDAAAFYNNLRIGDQVQVRATRPGSRPLPRPAARPIARVGSTPTPPRTAIQAGHPRPATTDRRSRAIPWPTPATRH